MKLASLARPAAPPRAPPTARRLVRAAPRAGTSSGVPPPARARSVAPAGAVAPAAAATPVKAAFPRGADWEVHKFGGTCVSSANRIAAVADLIAAELTSRGPASRVAAVVSAMGSHPSSPTKVTDLLLHMIDRAVKRDRAYVDDLAALRAKHAATAGELLEGDALAAFLASIDADIADLRAVLQAISIAGLAAGPFSDYVVGHGELWCARLLGAVLAAKGVDADVVDARTVLVVAPTPDDASVDVDYDESEAALDAAGGVARALVVTGFVARTRDGAPTTLKRNGSDYSATIVGALLRAASIVIWTDVDGVYSADPRKVVDAVCLASLSYQEAWELAYFGASVLHPRTTQPAMRAGVPIAIRNFFNRAAPGTVIRADPDPCPAAADVAVDTSVADTAAHGDGMVKGFATIDHVALINVEGTGMVGVPGIAAAIFGAVRDAGCNVVMISQASSEHSVCFAVKMAEADRAVAALEARFADALRAGRVSAIECVRDCCVMAAVGRLMCRRKGVAATMFSALAKANVNIVSIAQGCSEYNITVLIDQKDAVRALRAVHARFYLARLPLALAVVGPGLIGATFLAQLADQAETLRSEFDIDVRLLGVASSKRMVLSETGLDPARWQDALEAQGEPVDLKALGDHLAANYIPNTVIVDATASDAPPSHYLAWMKQGVHVVTPNKKLGSGPLAQYAALRQIQRESYIHFFYEATVGAGLPVVATLKHLVDTGDRVLRVEGVLSGTLSYIFNTLAPGTPFSSVVAEAKAAGFTEPDPRDDLSGTDVARKVTILAREAGVALELADVPVQSLVPDALADPALSPDAFMAGLPAHDDAMEARLAGAAARGAVLRFVGVVDVAAGTGAVELREYPADHPFASLAGADNIISFTTARYKNQPLIVRGPGAGAEVTAGGVFSDVLRLAAYLGAPS